MSQRDVHPPLTDSDVTGIAAFVLRHVTVTMRQADRKEKVNDIKRAHVMCTATYLIILIIFEE